MTLVIPFDGEIDIKSIIYLFPITKIDIIKPKRKSKKFKVPHCKKVGAIISARYGNITRGIVRSVKKNFKNCITLDISTEIKNLDPLPWLNHLHFRDSRRRGKRPMLYSRWGGLGNHRYPIGFSGDAYTNWESLAFQPYFTATAANVCYGWWSHDIGGHFGAADPELYARWVQFGLSPSQAIVAATRTPAELLGLNDLGLLAPGKSADFIVLTANPLENIRNTREISAVYMRGAALDRRALATKFKAAK